MTDWNGLANNIGKAESDLAAAKDAMRRALGIVPTATRARPRRRSVSGIPTTGTRTDAVVAVISKLGTASVREVAWNAAFTPEHAMVILSNLAKKGILVRVAKGQYSLPPAGMAAKGAA